MGYYSDVGLCLTAKGKQALNAALADAEKNNVYFEEINNLLKYVEIHTDSKTGTVGYRWASTKWYEDFGEVAFIENFLSTLDKSDYLFLRVGDDSADTECHGTFWANPVGLRFVREVVLG